MLALPPGRMTAPMAGARVSHRAMVTTIEVRYPNGRIPTSVQTMPAKTISSHALTKNIGPAAMSLTNASTINHLPSRRPGSAITDRAGGHGLGRHLELHQRPAGRASADVPRMPGPPALLGLRPRRSSGTGYRREEP